MTLEPGVHCQRWSSAAALMGIAVRFFFLGRANSLRLLQP